MATADQTVVLGLYAQDNISRDLINMGQTADATANRFSSFQNRLERRTTFFAGEVVQQQLAALGIQIPGVGRLFDVLASGMTRGLGITMGVSLAVGGLAAAYLALKNRQAEVSKEQAELNDKFDKAIISMSKLRAEGDKNAASFSAMSREALKGRYAEVGVQVEGLKEKLNELYQARIREGVSVQITGKHMREINRDIVNTKVQISELIEKQHALNEALMARPKSAIDAEARQEKMSSLAILEAGIQQRLQESRLQSVAAAEAQIRREHDITAKRITALGLNTYRTQEALQLNSLAMEYQIAAAKQKIWAENNKTLLDLTYKTLDLTGAALGELIVKGKADWRSMTKDMAVAVLDAVQLMIKAWILAHGAALNVWGVIKATAALAGLSILKGAIGALLAPEAAVAETASVAQLTQRGGIAATGAGGAAAGAGNAGGGPGGSSIASGFSQITNNNSFTIRFELLDPSQITEARMKEIVDRIGLLLQERIGTGQFGMVRA